MKIAIKANPDRKKEIISLLESLGGINSKTWVGDGETHTYYIGKNNIIEYDNAPKDYKVYTLEEFEKEFPFKVGNEVIFPVKIGWASGKITGLTYIEDKLKYEVYTRTSGYHYVESHKLSLYPMKEERNITLTLDKAKEWYKKGGELKEIALQAFSEKELNSLPKTWEEFCEKYPLKETEAVICCDSSIADCKGLGEKRDSEYYKDICPSKKSAEAHLAMIQLEQLRDCWRQGWKPTKHDTGYHIVHYPEEYSIMSFCFIGFLTFPTKEMAEEFLKCFRDLIEQAGDLI